MSLRYFTLLRCVANGYGARHLFALSAAYSLAGSTDDHSENPAVRWGFGLSSGTMIAAIALFLLEGTTQLLAMGIAAVDAVSTPQFLKHAVRE